MIGTWAAVRLSVTEAPDTRPVDNTALLQSFLQHKALLCPPFFPDGIAFATVWSLHLGCAPGLVGGVVPGFSFSIAQSRRCQPRKEWNAVRPVGAPKLACGLGSADLDQMDALEH